MMTADAERTLMTFMQRRLDTYMKRHIVEPINSLGSETICGKCAVELEQYGDFDWVHRRSEVETMRRMAAGGSWTE